MDPKLLDPAEVVIRYVRELEKIGIRPERVLLYGSYAKGTADLWSDIDLVVISSDLAGIDPLRRLEMLSLATGEVDAPIEALGYTPQEIAERGADSILWAEIQRSHKVMYEAAA